MLTVLLVHNHYRQPGGEDTVFEADAALLQDVGHRVVRFERTNDEVGVGTALAAPWSRSSQRAIGAVIDRERPNVVHVHNTFPLISPSIYTAAARRGVPVVQTVANYRMVCASANLWRDAHACRDCVGRALSTPAIIHGCYRGSHFGSGVVAAVQFSQRRHLASRYLAVSAFVADVLVSSGAVPPDRVEVRPNPCLPEPSVTGDKGGAVVFAGRLTPEKGIDTLLAAAARVPDQDVLIAGGGPIPRDAPPNVSFLGPLSRPAALDLIGTARCLVLPSVWEEPFGVVLIEAAALGVGVIASRVGGIPEIVTPDTGVLVPPGDVSALAAALATVGADPRAWAARGRAGRARYEASYGAAPSLERLLGAYARAGVKA